MTERVETTPISSGVDVIDVRDIIARIEALEKDHFENCGTALEDCPDEDEHEELAALMALMEDLKGNGGDEEWRGAWYPLLLIRDSYFEGFAQQEAEDLGLIKRGVFWPYNHIDWEAAADELKNDYSEYEFDGVAYLARG